MASDQVKETTYWLDPPPAPACSDPLPEKTGALVVGGGYTGLAAALRLAKAGVAVSVIDARPMGTAASGRNGGMVLTGLSDTLSSVIRRYGLETAEKMFAESVESVAAVERLVEEGNIDCNFRRTGYLLAAYKSRHMDELLRHRDMLGDRFGQSVRILSAAEFQSEVRTPLYKGALLDPLGAGLHPARYAAGLIEMARKAGAGLHENTTALKIEPRSGGFEIRTDRGLVRAETVVVGTNGYTGRLTPYLRRRIVPVRSLMIATETLPPELARSLIPNDRMVADTKNFLFYFRLSPDGRRLLFGGRPRFYARSLRENAEFMRRNMLTVFPDLKPFRVEYCWWGRLGFTMDRLPHIGQHRGMYYAMGYCGHGVAMATHLGENLAAMALGRPVSTAFAVPKFRAVPFYNGRPWFLPLVYGWFGLKDRWF